MNWSRSNSPVSPDKTRPSHTVLQLSLSHRYAFSHPFVLLPTCLQCPSLHSFLKVTSSKPPLSGMASVEISSSYYMLFSTVVSFVALNTAVMLTPRGTNWVVLTSHFLRSPHSHPKGTNSDYRSFSSLCFQCPTPSSTQGWCSLCEDDWINENFKCMPRM